MTTRREEINNDNGVELGIDIDIFPLDTWDDNAKRHVKKQVQRMLWLRLAKNRKVRSTNIRKTIMKKTVAIFCKILGSSFFIKKLQKGATQQLSATKNIGCVIWPVYDEREIIPAEVFIDTIDVEFEGHIFSAPIGYDIYLRSLYGDYKQDPPLEKQKTHHRFRAYRL